MIHKADCRNQTKAGRRRRMPDHPLPQSKEAVRPRSVHVLPFAGKEPLQPGAAAQRPFASTLPTSRLRRHCFGGEAPLSREQSPRRAFAYSPSGVARPNSGLTKPDVSKCGAYEDSSLPEHQAGKTPLRRPKFDPSPKGGHPPDMEPQSPDHVETASRPPTCGLRVRLIRHTSDTASVAQRLGSDLGIQLSPSGITKPRGGDDAVASQRALSSR